MMVHHENGTTKNQDTTGNCTLRSEALLFTSSICLKAITPACDRSERRDHGPMHIDVLTDRIAGAAKSV